MTTTVVAAIRIRPIPILLSILATSGVGALAATYIHYKILGFDLVWSMSPLGALSELFRVALFSSLVLSFYFVSYSHNERVIRKFLENIKQIETEIHDLRMKESQEREGVGRDSVKDEIKSKMEALGKLESKTSKRKRARVAIEEGDGSISIFFEFIHRTKWIVVGTYLLWLLISTFVRLYPIGVDRYCDDQDLEHSSWMGKVVAQSPHIVLPQCRSILIDLTSSGQSDGYPASMDGIYQVGRFGGYLFFIRARNGESLVFPENRIVATSGNTFPQEDLSTSQDSKSTNVTFDGVVEVTPEATSPHPE